MSGAAPIGPGLFIAVAGPSGAGKDTLIDGARTALTKNPLFVFPRRIVTREATASEEHDSLSADAFETARRSGHFALWWEAHGHHYALPCAIDDHLRAGKTVVCNVSRTVIETIRLGYENTRYVLITAPPDILAQRLTRRRRASDGNILDRARRIAQAPVSPDMTIENLGSPEDGIHAFLACLTAEKQPSDSPNARAVQNVI